MHRTRKLFMVSIGCAGILMALLLTVALIAHLLANREMVKSFIVAKTDQATGDTLDYDRLEIGFLPLPHLKARDIRLHRPEAFEVYAQELSAYPRILPLLKGRVSIRRLSLVAPDINVRIGSIPLETPGSPTDKEGRSFKEGLRTTIGGLFGALGTIDPGTDLRIEDGVVTLAFTDAPALRMTGINAVVKNDSGDLSLNLHCRSDLSATVDLNARADIAAGQASGKATLTGINVRPLFAYAALPGGIATEDTRATINTTFTLNGPETVHSRFDLQFPTLAVMRKNLKLNLETVAISGTVDYAGESLSVSIDTLQSAQPALDLTAAASIAPVGEAGMSVVEVHAAAGRLDVATAGFITQAIAGDLEAIKTAFAVAKEGDLTDATYLAKFETAGNGLRLTKMKASGHITRGLVTIPGIDADLEEMDGDVAYEDQHVAFNNASGHFKGATFNKLDAAIDWEKESTLSIASSSVKVDMAPFYNWLTAFEDLAELKKIIGSIVGSVRLSALNIDGPLTKPQNWAFDISGTPQAIRVTSPLVPFEVELSGGEIQYIPGKERAIDVKISFLDGSFVSSWHSPGSIDPEYTAWRIDGSMGQVTLDWLSTVLPIPQHLQMKPPVDLLDVTIIEKQPHTVSVKGQLKTAGGVTLYTDVTRSSDGWQIHKIHFLDDRSTVVVSARQLDSAIELTFSGNIEKQSADRLLRNNRILSGRLEGDFHAVINTHAPLNSSFTGNLAGEGLHIHHLLSESIDVKQFSIDGSGGQLKIAPSEVFLCNNLLVVDGTIDRGNNGLTFDLNVDADRLDAELIHTLNPGKEKQKPSSTLLLGGNIHLKATDFTFNDFTWSPVKADIRVDNDNIHIQLDQANLCGISTTGALGFSPEGMSLQITPTATNVSLQETIGCLWDKQIKADARYDLTGEINLPPTREAPAQFLSGQMEFSSINGRIDYGNLLMKILSILNVTEAFTGGHSDLTKTGVGYARAHIMAEIGEGKVQFNEILMDGNSLKITGQGSIDLKDQEADIILLVAPLKTVDRIVNKLPVVNYIIGGSLVSIPLRVKGKISDPSVVTMPPAAVSKGLLGIMARTLKAPFKLVEGVAQLASEEAEKGVAPPPDTTQKGP